MALVTLDTTFEELMALSVKGEPLEALASERPCELYSYHAPKVVQTSGHHLHPVYLQNRLFGRIVDNQLMWMCSNCHAAVHEWLYWIMGEKREPSPHPGTKAKANAMATLEWYITNGGVLRGIVPR